MELFLSVFIRNSFTYKIRKLIRHQIEFFLNFFSKKKTRMNKIIYLVKFFSSSTGVDSVRNMCNHPKSMQNKPRLFIISLRHFIWKFTTDSIYSQICTYSVFIWCPKLMISIENKKWIQDIIRWGNSNGHLIITDEPFNELNFCDWWMIDMFEANDVLFPWHLLKNVLILG